MLLHRLSQYGEFRAGYDKDTTDTRIVFYGLKYVLDSHINKQWTAQDVQRAELFFRYAIHAVYLHTIQMVPTHIHHQHSTHLAGYRPFPFPKALFDKIINDCNGMTAFSVCPFVVTCVFLCFSVCTIVVGCCKQHPTQSNNNAAFNRRPQDISQSPSKHFRKVPVYIPMCQCTN